MDFSSRNHALTLKRQDSWVAVVRGRRKINFLKKSQNICHNKGLFFRGKYCTHRHTLHFPISMPLQPSSHLKGTNKQETLVKVTAQGHSFILRCIMVESIMILLKASPLLCLASTKTRLQYDRITGKRAERHKLCLKRVS